MKYNYILSLFLIFLFNFSNTNAQDKEILDQIQKAIHEKSHEKLNENTIIPNEKEIREAVEIRKIKLDTRNKDTAIVGNLIIRLNSVLPGLAFINFGPHKKPYTVIKIGEWLQVGILNEKYWIILDNTMKTGEDSVKPQGFAEFRLFAISSDSLQKK